MKQYQNLLAQYLACRREGNHKKAAELAHHICDFWHEKGDIAECAKWQSVYLAHVDSML